MCAVSTQAFLARARALEGDEVISGRDLPHNKYKEDVVSDQTSRRILGAVRERTKKDSRLQ